jgi:hypothetical protein
MGRTVTRVFKASSWRCRSSSWVSSRALLLTIGFAVPGKPGRVVLRDAAPAHAGFRWGVVIEEPGPGQPLVTRVIALTGEKLP